MSGKNDIPGAGCNSTAGEAVPVRLPQDFIELIELRPALSEHKLGYSRSEPFVIFGYCPGGGEVIWRDEYPSGVGTEV